MTDDLEKPQTLADDIAVTANGQGAAILEWLATDNPNPYNLTATLSTLRNAKAVLAILDDSIVNRLHQLVGFTGQRGLFLGDQIGTIVVYDSKTYEWEKAGTIREICLAATGGDIDAAKEIAEVLVRCFNAAPNFSVTGLRSLGVDVDAFRTVKAGRPRANFI